MAGDADAEQGERNARRSEELDRIPMRKADQTGWPKGVRRIGIAELNGLGIDLDGRLYWHGKSVEIIGQRIVLTYWQRVYALVLGAGALAAFLVTLGQGLAALADWTCKVQWTTSATLCGPLVP